MTYLSRRTLLRGTVAGGAGVALSSLGGRSAWAGDIAPGVPNPGVPLPVKGMAQYPRPDMNAPAGQAMDYPFDHVVVIMQENHSFDNYFGMLSKRGQPAADGFTFAPGTTTPTNANPHASGAFQRVFRNEGTCQPGNISQGWGSSHTQVNGGRMDGFSGNWPAAMGYWDQPDIPFYYDLATKFALGNRSFCSVLGQTYPNRRYLYSGTSSGMTSTTTDTFTTVPYPSGGTLWDNLETWGVSWKSYFTDLPVVGIIPQTVENYPGNFTTVADFFADCAAGTLPQVSFIDTEAGVADEVGGGLNTVFNATSVATSGLNAQSQTAIATVRSANGDEEDPADIAIGEASVAAIINAVLSSKSPVGSNWSNTLVIWTYDEHGGYYDHVPPVPMAAPDTVQPEAGNVQYNGYQTSGIRIPTVVISPYSKPNYVSNVVHDHTAVIKTIATKWNLPALTMRDYLSPDLFNYLDFSNAQYATPPSLATPALPAATLGDCETSQSYTYEAAADTPVPALPDAAAPVLLPVAGLAGAALLAVKRWNTRQKHNAGVALAEREGVRPPDEPALLTETPRDYRSTKGNE